MCVSQRQREARQAAEHKLEAYRRAIAYFYGDDDLRDVDDYVRGELDYEEACERASTTGELP